jgi:hypothetical protein
MRPNPLLPLQMSDESVPSASRSRRSQSVRQDSLGHHHNSLSQRFLIFDCRGESECLCPDPSLDKSVYAVDCLKDFATLRTSIAVITIASPVVIRLMPTIRPSVQLALAGQE